MREMIPSSGNPPSHQLSTEDTAGIADTQTSLKTCEPLSLDSSSQSKYKMKGFLKRNAFILLTVAAVAIGAGMGFALQSTNMTARQIKYFMFPGELLIQMMQLLVIPLIASSLITGMASLDRKSCGKIGTRAICYYGFTSFMAVFTGIVVVVLIKPGQTTHTTDVSVGKVQSLQPVDTILDLIRNVFPANMVATFFRQYKTVYSKNECCDIINLTQTDDRVPMDGTTENPNILGILVVCIAFGLTLGSMENEGKPMRDFFECLNKATMRLIRIAIWYSPVGILFMVGGQILAMKDIGLIGRQLGMYTITVITGLLVHSFFTLPLIYVLATRKNPFTFMVGLLEALSTAFGTSSSIVTLPVSIRCLENNLNMDSRVTRALIPIAATLTMDGTALYEAVAAIFIAQVYELDLHVVQLIIISLTATVASIGATGIPQGGMVTMVFVLSSVGLPPEGITFIVAADWMLDRLRTVANVLADCVGVGVVHHLSKNERQLSTSTQHLVENSRATPSD